MHSPVCILTDSTAQFPSAAFPGQELVNIIPLHIHYKGKFHYGGRGLKIQDLPMSRMEDEHPKLIAPSAEEFRKVLTSLEQQYHQMVLLLLSKHLNPAITFAKEAIESLKGRASVLLIDSETCGVGLGLLVQAAAGAAKKGASLAEINLLVRGLISRVYMLLCLHDLIYLSQGGHLDPAQAMVGEMLSIAPLYLLEYGKLFPMQKVRSQHHLLDMLQEFIGEFTAIQHIALVRGIVPFEQEARTLRERVSRDFPRVSFSEHLLNSEMASIFGPRCLGLVVLEG
jgi:DegV family protein with EDD domain